MLPSQEFFSKQVLKFTPKSDGWRGGGEGFGFLWTLPPGSATVSRHVRYPLYAQYAGINKQNKLYWYF